MEEGGCLVANKEEQIRKKGSTEGLEEEASNNKSCIDPQRMDMSEKQKEDSTNDGVVEEEKVISELTTNESTPNTGQGGVRERRVCKDTGEKEEAVDEVDASEKGQLKVEESNFVPEKKKASSQGVQLLTYFEAPPHLRFNQYVLGSYRPPMDVHGCLARLVKCYFCEY